MRLEETGRTPSRMVAPNFAHTFCLLRRIPDETEVPASQVVITTATTSTSAIRPHTATREE